MTDPLAHFRPGVTVVLHPSTRRIGAALRDKDLDVAAVLAVGLAERGQGEDPGGEQGQPEADEGVVDDGAQT